MFNDFDPYAEDPPLPRPSTSRANSRPTEATPDCM